MEKMRLHKSMSRLQGRGNYEIPMSMLHYNCRRDFREVDFRSRFFLLLLGVALLHEHNNKQQGVHEENEEKQPIYNTSTHSSVKSYFLFLRLGWRVLLLLSSTVTSVASTASAVFACAELAITKASLHEHNTTSQRRK